MTNEEHVRAQLVQIWEDLDQRGKDRFATMLGFEGKPESKRRSARRLVQGSRSISPEKQRKIRRSYAQRYGRDKVVDLEDREKVDVTEYFKPLLINQGGGRIPRAWNGESPPLAFQVPYRIRAVTVVVQEDSTFGWYSQELEIWTRGVGRTFSQLASMLQREIDQVFRPKKKYETFGMALDDSAVSTLIDRANSSPNVTNEVAAPSYRGLNIMIYSTPDSFGKRGAYEEVSYDD